MFWQRSPLSYNVAFQSFLLHFFMVGFVGGKCFFTFGLHGICLRVLKCGDTALLIGGYPAGVREALICI
ncbi:hypothetical protein ACFPVS_11945 [Neisseria weixii]|uniref:hypothetical protein n=1 Tax=Neisseria weixii TaxID=1853276 RepID=UPI0012FE2077|nr:hypothetical protein [Neisseria weixii]